MEPLDPSQQPAPEAVGETAAAEASAQAAAADSEMAEINTDEKLESSVEQPAEVREEAPATKEEILAAAAALAAKDAAEISNDEVTHLKQQFYMLHNSEQRAEREAFAQAGNDPGVFVPQPDPAEEEFKLRLTEIRDKKAALRAETEARQAENEKRKREIIARLNEMSTDTDNVNRLFPELKDLQTEFKSIGEVPPTVATELWKAYQDAVEHFYDQLKVNKELRDYDFKKNLAEKELLISEAQKLVEEPDVIVAFRRLQELHDKWREIGPVPKDVREEIWNRFKDFSAEINKRYQAHFEERKARERENEDAKTALCERIEALDFSGLSTYAAWDAMTREIIAAQEDWKKIGYASRRANNTLFARFRETCDKFFAAKAEFFKEMKDTLASNLEKKIALCERAEALKDSTDWRKTADELAELQRQWKTIGAVAKKHSDQVWHRFLAACDYFFEQKKKNTSGTRRSEQANLKAKKDIIARLEAIDPATADRAEAIKTVKALQTEWQAIGHVPFGEKDAVYDAYRKVTNSLYDALDISGNRGRFASFENNINEMAGDENRLFRERERLMRVLEQRRSELRTFENNLSFLSTRSKNGDSMLREMERRSQRLKDDIADLEKKVKVIDAKVDSI